MTNKHGPTNWGGRFAYFLLLVVKPVFLLIGVVAGSNILAVTGVALILLALAVALTLEERAHGTWQETHFDFLVRSIGVWTALAFNVPIFGTMLMGGPILIAVMCGIAEVAIDVALLAAWLKFERSEPVPEKLFNLCGIRSHWSQRQADSALREAEMATAR